MVIISNKEVIILLVENVLGYIFLMILFCRDLIILLTRKFQQGQRSHGKTLRETWLKVTMNATIKVITLDLDNTLWCTWPVIARKRVPSQLLHCRKISEDREELPRNMAALARQNHGIKPQHSNRFYQK